MSYENLAQLIEDNLPTLINRIATNNSSAPYIQNPDYLEDRLLKWHQFGIVTHSKMVRKAFLEESRDYLKAWGVYDKILNHLSIPISSIEKKLLFEISIPLHDLGKVIVSNSKEKNRSHEVYSANLLHEHFSDYLKGLGLLDPHLNYISECIKTHAVLGKEVRDKLNDDNLFNLDLKNNCVLPFQDLANKYKNVQLELGLFFLCDCLGKTDIRVPKDTSDQEIYNLLKSRNIDNNLIGAIKQLPINLLLSESYLKSLRVHS